MTPVPVAPEAAMLPPWALMILCASSAHSKSIFGYPVAKQILLGACRTIQGSGRAAAKSILNDNFNSLEKISDGRGS